MTGYHLRAQARRVVSGTDESGLSAIVEDSHATRRVAAPAFTICDVWETQSLPVSITRDAVVDGDGRR